ncbi:MAG: tRNA (adenosine(37)-N6)-threonylcarbamoyltransferase complex ATPase subunit type 1 TsaE [Planktomarina sp.]
MGQITQHLNINSEADMATLGAQLGGLLTAGKTIVMQGQIGAGKSTLARALIQSLLTIDEDVPSPTFTIVQTYDAPDFQLWHCDLYRLNSLDQVDELGLWDAFGDSACLIEWPEILGKHLPKSTMILDIQVTGDNERSITITAPERHWPNLTDTLNATHR